MMDRARLTQRARLLVQHAEREAALAAERARLQPDEAKITALKREKLRLKDALAALDAPPRRV